LTATAGNAAPTVNAEVLPTIVIKQHTVAKMFPVESLVEAVQQATVGAQISGRILEVKADAGQQVKKGEVLMRIDAREAEEAARAADAQYANAKLNYERNKSLKEQKFVSQAAVALACKSRFF
jgi:multidrug efflux pump subunit AcrA (membrane-fusion protein)